MRKGPLTAVHDRMHRRDGVSESDLWTAFGLDPTTIARAIETVDGAGEDSDGLDSALDAGAQGVELLRQVEVPAVSDRLEEETVVDRRVVQRFLDLFLKRSHVRPPFGAPDQASGQYRGEGDASPGEASF
jgi:hypothetical protein